MPGKWRMEKSLSDSQLSFLKEITVLVGCIGFRKEGKISDHLLFCIGLVLNWFGEFI